MTLASENTLASVSISVHSAGRDGLGEFIEFPYRLFASDPAWIPPLRREMRERLDPAKNPFFSHAEAAFFVARKNGQVVGRCSAQVDQEHLKTHNDNTGFFGFLDTVNDQSVCDALLAAARSWLQERGMLAMRGPVSLSMNDEAGVLVSGFDSPPAMMMPHSLPYQSQLIEHSGLHSVKELNAWRYDVGAIPQRAIDAWNHVRDLQDLRFRSVNMRRLQQDVAFVHEILNDAWSSNWGFVGMTPAELNKLANDLKLIIDPRISFFVEVEGHPVAMCICLPNLNEVIADFDGNLGPINIARLLWRIKVKTPQSARLIVLGIRHAYRKRKRYGALSTAMYVEIAKRAATAGYKWAELGWTLDDNHRINAGITKMGARIYKRYRIYEQQLS